jgi:hypothetical protein
MSAVMTTGGPILALVEELQQQVRNLTTTVVDNLTGELSTARETHAAELKAKDEAHDKELAEKDKAHDKAMAAKDKAHDRAMASKDKAHAEAMTATAAAQATAMSSKNQTVRTIRRERNACRTDLAYEREAHRNTTADLGACRTRRDECLRNATRRAAEPRDEWMMSFAYYLSPYQLPVGVPLGRSTLITFVIGTIFWQLVVILSMISVPWLLISLFHTFRGPRPYPRLRHDLPCGVCLLLVLLYFGWLGGLGWLTYSVIPWRRGGLLVVVAVLLNRAWNLVTVDSFVYRCLVHVGFDLGLPPARQAELTGELAHTEARLAGAANTVFKMDPNIREFCPSANPSRTTITYADGQARPLTGLYNYRNMR